MQSLALLVRAIGDTDEFGMEPVIIAGFDSKDAFLGQLSQFDAGQAGADQRTFVARFDLPDFLGLRKPAEGYRMVHVRNPLFD